MSLESHLRQIDRAILKELRRFSGAHHFATDRTYRPYKTKPLTIVAITPN